MGCIEMAHGTRKSPELEESEYIGVALSSPWLSVFAKQVRNLSELGCADGLAPA